MNYYQREEVVRNAWSSELPADILGMITDTLSLSEFIRFGSVCLGWRSFSIENYQHIKIPNKLPLLLIPIPPSSLLSTHHHHHHHKKMISSFPPSSSSLLDDDDDDDDDEEEEENEEEELEEKEEKLISHKEESEEKDIEDKDFEKEEIKDDENEEEEIKDDENEEEEKETGEEEEEEEEEEEWRPRFKVEHYYNPNEIWEGQEPKQRHKNRRTFYSLSEKKVYHDFQLPVPYYKNILGSSYGWLVTVQECYAAADNGELYLLVSLLNPFRTDNNNEIQLPPITNGNLGNLDIGERINQSYFLQKAFLSANPSSLSDPTTQLLVFGIYGNNRLAFCRPGDKAWTRLDLEQYRPIEDVICYKGQIYAVLQNGIVFAFVLDPTQPLPMPIVTLKILPPNEVDPCPQILPPNEVDPCLMYVRRYLVESGGDLLQIRRTVGRPTLAESGRPYPTESDYSYITRQFLVFKLDPTGHWVEMKTLDDCMLFIGTSSSISLSASDFPGWSKPNSIYYTDDYHDCFVVLPLEGPHDIGIFNLEDGSFERHYEAESKTVMPPPIWIQPML